MAEEEGGEGKPPGLPRRQQLLGCLQQQSSSSPTPSESTSGGSYPPSSSLGEESGRQRLASSEDSLDDYDTPLDFSIKKPRREEFDIKPALNGFTPGHHLNNSVSHGTPSPPARHQPLAVKTEVEDPGYNPELGSRMNGLSPISPYTSNSSSPGRERPEDRRIGEPQTGLPGMLPGTVIPGSGGVVFPGLPPAPSTPMEGGYTSPDELAKNVPSSPETPNGSSKSGSSRPFKSYPKDALSLPLPQLGPVPANLPGLSSVDLAAAQAMAVNSEELFAAYRQYVLGQINPDDSNTTNGRSGVRGPSAQAPRAPQPSGATPRRRGRAVPDTVKDEAYWERRRKNNEAAKRSRDTRRAKEDEIAIRAAFLEQENLKLRIEVAALKNETSKLRCMLYNS